MLTYEASCGADSQGGTPSVGSTAAATLIIGGVIGMFVGWNWRTARGANADLKVHKGRIPGFRRARNRTGLISIALVVLTLLALSAFVRG